jgi:hypothetical protein
VPFAATDTSTLSLLIDSDSGPTEVYFSPSLKISSHRGRVSYMKCHDVMILGSWHVRQPARQTAGMLTGIDCIAYRVKKTRQRATCTPKKKERRRSK